MPGRTTFRPSSNSLTGVLERGPPEWIQGEWIQGEWIQGVVKVS